MFSILKKIFKDYLIQILLIVLSISCSYSIYLWCSEQTVAMLGMENSLFELFTVCFFLIASIFFFRAFLNTKSIFLLLLSILMFLGAGEELSWGQHFLKFTTPESIRKENIQGEFNLHNLGIFNAGDEFHVKRTGWKRLLEINFLFRLFCIAFGILLPLIVMLSPFFKKFVNRIKMPVPPIIIGIFFLINWVAFRTTFESLPKGKPDEPNTISLISTHFDNNSSRKMDSLIFMEIDLLLKDPARNAIISSFEVIRRGQHNTSFDISFKSFAERKQAQSKEMFERLSEIQNNHPEMNIALVKDDNYYSTSTETFECISALIFLLISIGFYRRKEALFTQNNSI
jgi:hypothetical protein